MDWVHCNTCFVVPTESSAQLSITNCGHLFCDGCLKTATDKKCRMCGRIYSSTIPLSKDMKPDVQIYFQDPGDVFKSSLKQIKLSQQVIDFQNGHSKRLRMYHKRQLSKAGEMMKHAKELEKKYRLVSMECEALKHFVSSLGYKPNDVMQKVGCYPMTPAQSPMATPRPMMGSETPKAHTGQSRMQESTYPRSSPSPMQYSQSGANTSSRMSPSPVRQQYVSASQTSLNRSKTGCSPQQGAKGPSPGVPPVSRLTIRTPPMNGKIGPVGSSSPGYISPSGQSSQSKIAQMLSASRNSIPAAASTNYQQWKSTLRTPTLDGKRPIQVHPRGPRS